MNESRIPATIYAGTKWSNVRSSLAAVMFILTGCSTQRSDDCVASSESPNATVEVLDALGGPLESVPVVATLDDSILDCRRTGLDGRLEIHVEPGSAATAFRAARPGTSALSQSVTRTGVSPGDFLKVILTNEVPPNDFEPVPILGTTVVTLDGLGNEPSLLVNGGCGFGEAEGPNASVPIDVSCLQSDGNVTLTAIGFSVDSTGLFSDLLSFGVAVDIAPGTPSVALVLSTATDAVPICVRFPTDTSLGSLGLVAGTGVRTLRKGLPVGAMEGFGAAVCGTAGVLAGGEFRGVGPSVADTLEVGMLYALNDTAGELGMANVVIRQSDVTGVDRDLTDFPRVVALTMDGPTSGDPVAAWSLRGTVDRVRVDFTWPVGDPDDPDAFRHRATVFVEPATLSARIPRAPGSFERFRPSAGTNVGVVVVVDESDFVTGYVDFPGWFDFFSGITPVLGEETPGTLLQKTFVSAHEGALIEGGLVIPP